MRCPLANKREIVVVLSKTPVGGVFQPNKRSRDVQFQKFPKDNYETNKTKTTQLKIQNHNTLIEQKR